MSAPDQTDPPATDTLVPGAGVIEAAPDPLFMLAADANDLAGRIHGGQGSNLDELITRAIAERSAERDTARRAA